MAHNTRSIDRDDGGGEGSEPQRKRPRRAVLRYGSDYHTLALKINPLLPRPRSWQTIDTVEIPALDAAQKARFSWGLSLEGGEALVLAPVDVPVSTQASSSKHKAGAGRVTSTASTARGKLKTPTRSARGTSHASSAEDEREDSTAAGISLKSIIIRNQCHSCQRSLSNPMMRCRSISNGIVCPAFFCRRCIKTDYPGSIKWDTDSRSFQCPKCLGFCKCRECVHTRRTRGDHLLNGRSYEVIAMRANARKQEDDDDDDDDIIELAPSAWKAERNPVFSSSSTKTVNQSSWRREGVAWDRTGRRRSSAKIPSTDDEEEEEAHIVDPEWSPVKSRARKPVSVPRRGQRVKRARPYGDYQYPTSSRKDTQKERSLSASASTSTLASTSASASASCSASVSPTFPLALPTPTPSSRPPSPEKSERTPTTFWRSGSEVDPPAVAAAAANAAAARLAAQQDVLESQHRRESLKIRIRRPKSGLFALFRREVSPLRPDEIERAAQRQQAGEDVLGASAAGGGRIHVSSTSIGPAGKQMEAERNVWVRGFADLNSEDEIESDLDAQRGGGEYGGRWRHAFPWHDSPSSTLPTTIRPRPTHSDDDGMSESEHRWPAVSTSLPVDAQPTSTTLANWLGTEEGIFALAAGSSALKVPPEAMTGYDNSTTSSLTPLHSSELEPCSADARDEDGGNVGAELSLDLNHSMAIDMGLVGVGSESVGGLDLDADVAMTEEPVAGQPVAEEEDPSREDDDELDTAMHLAGGNSDALLQETEPMLSPGDVDRTAYMAPADETLDYSIEGGMATIEGDADPEAVAAAVAAAQQAVSSARHSPDAKLSPALFVPPSPADLRKLSVDGSVATPVPVPSYRGAAGAIRPGARDANLSMSLNLSMTPTEGGEAVFGDEDGPDHLPLYTTTATAPSSSALAPVSGTEPKNELEAGGGSRSDAWSSTSSLTPLPSEFGTPQPEATPLGVGQGRRDDDGDPDPLLRELTGSLF